MNKKGFLVLVAWLLFFGFLAEVTAADSCNASLGDSKAICNSVTNTKNDFYKKYSMDSANSTSSSLSTSLCTKLSGVEKDTCFAKNHFIEQHSLTNIPGTASVQAQASSSESTSVIQSASSSAPSLVPNNDVITTEPKTVSGSSSKMNIFNN